MKFEPRDVKKLVKVIQRTIPNIRVSTAYDLAMAIIEAFSDETQS